MHLLVTGQGSLDDEATAVDLKLEPSDLVFLSFSDSDLAVTAAAFAQTEGLPSLRLARLAELKHSFSVDLLVERLSGRTRLVLVRLLGGLDYWRYGVDELGAAARRYGFHLAVVPGDDRADPRLDTASTLPQADLRRFWRYFQEGGSGNFAEALRLAAARAGWDMAWRDPVPVPAAGLFEGGCRRGSENGPHVLMLFYRSLILAADTAPVVALADALAARGAVVTSLFVSSLKDEVAQSVVTAQINTRPPDVILNATAFSARRGLRGAVTDRAGVPVLQVVLSTGRREAWSASSRGLASTDLAMHVVLPELDGRILAGLVSCKAEAGRFDDVGFTRLAHQPEPSRIAHAATLALAWAHLRRTPRPARRIGCVISDYPGRDGREGYAVGLDTPASLLAIADHLRQQGFSVGPLPEAPALMRALTAEPGEASLSLDEYRHHLAGLPEPFVAAVGAAWGDPAADAAVCGGHFRFRFLRAGRLTVAIQPGRGAVADRRTDYHDTARPPRHAYIAFYLWLRRKERIDAMIHLGTHGTLEWLPGKAVALGPDCAPEVVLGPLPVIYPFIVNNPGEAAQAKRRIGAVTLGHMTPPLMEAGAHGVVLELEELLDEYAQALTMDARRARLLGPAILDKAMHSQIAKDCGLAEGEALEPALARLDAWLCDIKDMRIGDGLHVYGQPLHRATHRRFLVGHAATATEDTDADLDGKLARCGPAELRRLVTALDGGFVQPGPSGAPARGRRDVLPTGRNLFTVDPRAVPTRTAWEMGRRVAAEVMTRYAQDHGDWPRRLVVDVWGSATMRTGGEDLAQALALIGVRPRWDNGTGRVAGYEVLPQASLDWPRVDVALRISGLFRDTFPEGIALFDAATRAVASLDEDDDENALAAHRRSTPDGTLPPRVFGTAPGRYGIGLTAIIATGEAQSRDELGQAYLATTSHVYGRNGEPTSAPHLFRAAVARADAYVHVQDLPGSDLLDASPNADHEGGFAAAAAALGRAPALYHADTTRLDRLAVRSLAEEIARVVRGRATNPRWLAGQMRHGHRGAAEIAETVDNLFAFAATTDAVPSHHFDLLFDAVCGDEAVRAFLIEHNAPAAQAIAERFAAARERRFWTSRRNSVTAVLDGMRGIAA